MLFTLTGRFDTNKAYPGGLQNIHSVWDTMESVCGDLDAVEDPHFGVKMTYKEVFMMLFVKLVLS